MYHTNKHQLDKFRFHQQFPYHSSCNPATLKFSGRIMPQTYPSVTSAESRHAVVPIPVSVAATYPHDEDVTFSKQRLMSPSPSCSSSSSSSWWSWTFGIVTAPLAIWGCPFYLWTMSPPPAYYPQIRSTRIWLKRVFDCTSTPFVAILTTFLIALTTLSNAYLIYLFCILFNNLFIRGVYEASMLKDVFGFIRDMPVIIIVNYVWLFGFRINNIISHLNQKYRKYRYHVSCSRFRLSVLAMILVIICLHTVRFFSFKKYSVFYEENADVVDMIEHVWEFSTDIFLTLLLPLYCAFCYAVRFELFIIKALIYDGVSKRVMPTIAHLDKFKTLYTHAADHIDAINGFFSFYMSLVIGLIILGTVMDADALLSTLLTAVVDGIVNNVFGGEGNLGDKLKEMFGGGGDGTNQSPPPFLPPTPSQSDVVNGGSGTTGNKTALSTALSPEMVRQMNADIVCLLATYGLIFYTVWQAVVTNDYVRELHVWLNDFVSGAGGTDVEGMLMDVGAKTNNAGDGSTRSTSIILRSNDAFGKGTMAHGYVEGHQLPLLWARNKPLEDGDNDQFLDKFKMLKAYIHVRLQLEKPSLLNVSLVGVFVPTLSGRLKNYNILF